MSPSCPHDPRALAGQPIGMYHCPDCGEMVLAGAEHPDYDTPLTEADHAVIEGRASSWPRRESPEPDDHGERDLRLLF